MKLIIKEEKKISFNLAYEYTEKRLKKEVKKYKITNIDYSEEYPGAVEVFFTFWTNEGKVRKNSMIVWYENGKIYGEW